MTPSLHLHQVDLRPPTNASPLETPQLPNEKLEATFILNRVTQLE